ncbi:MAG: hypothetical protein JSR41_10190 [Proteobacteria bacterium]|nr:hypothetical protein [Pseudomonadota bacterium]
MSGFDPAWLALREPFDRAARAASASQLDWPAFAARLHGSCAFGEPVQVTDLGCGTGASLREVAPRLGGSQHWHLIDHDMRLLSALPDVLSAWAMAQGWRATVDRDRLHIDAPTLRLCVEWRCADLSAVPDAALLAGAQLVAASALLDLVSASWTDALVARCHAARAAVCWALSVDDRVQWHPADPADAAVHRHFRAHQRRDKGFGAALGGDAGVVAAAALRRAGYDVAVARSDWAVDGSRSMADRALLREMVDGLAGAAREQAPDDAAVETWAARRRAQIADPEQAAALRLQVGHTDVLGWLG